MVYSAVYLRVYPLWCVTRGGARRCVLRSDVKMTRQKTVLWPGATPFVRRFLRPNHCRASGVAPGHVLPLIGGFLGIFAASECPIPARNPWQILPKGSGKLCQNSMAQSAKVRGGNPVCIRRCRLADKLWSTGPGSSQELGLQKLGPPRRGGPLLVGKSYQSLVRSSDQVLVSSCHNRCDRAVTDFVTSLAQVL